MFLTKLSMFKRNRYSFINFNKMGISNGKPKNGRVREEVIAQIKFLDENYNLKNQKND